MLKANRIGWMTLCGIVVLLATDASCAAQAPADNPYRPVRGLADGGGPSTPGGDAAFGHRIDARQCSGPGPAGGVAAQARPILERAPAVAPS
jgi:hypothetical protein